MDKKSRVGMVCAEGAERVIDRVLYVKRWCVRVCVCVCVSRGWVGRRGKEREGKGKGRGRGGQSWDEN